MGTCSFSSDGSLILTNAPHNAIEMIEGAEKRTFAHDKTVRIWDSESGVLKATLQHSSTVNVASFSHDGKHVVTGSTDGSVRIWSGITGEIEKLFERQDGSITAVGFDPDGRLLSAGSDGGTAWLWNVATGQEIGRLVGHSQAINSIAINSSNLLVTGSADHTARIWDVRAKGRIQSSRTEKRDGNDVVISPDGHRLAIRQGSSRVVELHALPQGDSVRHLENDGVVTQVQFSPAGDFVVTLTESGVARVFASNDGEPQMQIDSVGKPKKLLFNKENHLVLVSRTEKLVSIWDLNTKSMVQRKQFPETSELEYSTDVGTLLVWSKPFQNAEHHLELWNFHLLTDFMKLPTMIIPNQSRQRFLTFSKEGHLLVIRSPGLHSLELWDTRKSQRIAELEYPGTQAIKVDFSTDGKSIVIGASDWNARIWDAETGRLRADLSGYEKTSEVHFVSPNGNRVVTRSFDQNSRLWNGQTGESIGLLATGVDFVETALFSDDGNVLLTTNGTKDKALLWNSRSGEPIGNVAVGPSRRISSSTLSPDGQWFALAFDDGAAWILPVRVAEFVKTILPRRLTPDERDYFQIGTHASRAEYLSSSIETAAVAFFTQTGKIPVKSADQTTRLAAVNDEMIKTFLDSLPGDLTQHERSSALEAIEQAVQKNGPLSFSQCVSFGRMFAKLGRYQHAERLLRIAIHSKELADADLFQEWAVVSFRIPGRRPEEMLALLSEPPSPFATNLKWLLERLAKNEAILINAGGDDFRAENGRVWRHDCFFRGGHCFGELSDDQQHFAVQIAGTSDDVLYQTERWFDREQPLEKSGYQIPLPCGRYRVVLRFAEIHFLPPESRVFDVLVDGQVMISRYNTLDAGFATAASREFTIQVDDGRLELEFRGVTNDPKISAIEITCLDK